MNNNPGEIQLGCVFRPDPFIPGVDPGARDSVCATAQGCYVMHYAPEEIITGSLASCLRGGGVVWGQAGAPDAGCWGDSGVTGSLWFDEGF